MARYQATYAISRISPSLKSKLATAAAAQGMSESEFLRDLLEKGLRKKSAAHAADPLVEALHAVLPRYLRLLHDLVASARYDTVIAREMAQAAAFAAVLATDRTPDEARAIVQTTLGKAAKTAARRMHEHPDWTREAAVTTEPEEGEEEDDAAAGTPGR